LSKPVFYFEDLEVWKKSIDLVEDIYLLTKKLPKDETWGLYSQMRRAAVSISSNIVEGHSRESSRDFLRYIAIAKGSKSELLTQLRICVRVNYLTQSDGSSPINKTKDIGSMLNGLKKA
jgi:four helix bundle protein